MDILILGGGFSGVYAARTLARKYGHTDRKIGLISDENYMVFQPMLPEVVGGSLESRHVINPIRQLCRGLHVFRGEIAAIDLHERRVELNAGAYTRNNEFECQDLVITLGATVDLRRIPGMAEHAFLIRNVGDAMKLKAAVIAKLEEANLEPNRDARRHLLRFVVVGGGYSGVETAGQMIDLLRSVHRYYQNVDADDFSVCLVHSRDHLLPTLHEELGRYTERILRKRGVELHMNHRVKSVTARQVTLDDGSEVPANTVVCTVGNAPHPLLKSLLSQPDVESERGRLLTDAYCRVRDVPNVWAAGDCAMVPIPGDEPFAPPNAQFAYRQGILVGKNLIAEREHTLPRPFTFTGLGELASIGHRKAVADIFGIQFHGFIAWFMWRTIYLGKLPGIERKIRVMIEWTVELFFPRDINLVTPEYSSPITEMYLERDDMLFKAGEPAFSFYMVKSGRVAIEDDEGTCIKSIGPGLHFGERALLQDRVWRFTARAVEDSILVALGAHTFDTLISASGSIAHLLKNTASSYRSGETIAGLIEDLPEELRQADACDIMRRTIRSLNADLTISEALHIIQEHRHSIYPVLDEDGCIQGAVRRDELLQWLKNHALNDDARIGDVPTTGYLVVPPTLSGANVLERLIREGATKALVADDDQKLLGILTLMDLMGCGRPTLPTDPDPGKSSSSLP